LARRHMPMRNVGKNAYLRLIDVARFAARIVGEELTARGVVGAPDDVFLLTLDEITAADHPDDLRGLIGERRATRERNQAMRLRDTAWEGMPELIPAAGDRGPRTLNAVVQGTPVYPGVIEGRVRVVIDPAEISEPLGASDVIVARTTDPGWASLMLTAGAFVIDIGNPMSHAAVVARELGVPCVIGTENGTSVLRDGDRVRVDGGAGTVTVISAEHEQDVIHAG
jgi:phosphohistidine swiveling domain-containing protein